MVLFFYIFFNFFIFTFLWIKDIAGSLNSIVSLSSHFTGFCKNHLKVSFHRFVFSITISIEFECVFFFSLHSCGVSLRTFCLWACPHFRAAAVFPRPGVPFYLFPTLEEAWLIQMSPCVWLKWEALLQGNSRAIPLHIVLCPFGTVVLFWNFFTSCKSSTLSSTILLILMKTMASTVSPSYCQIRNSRNTARKSSGRVRKSSKEKRERAKTLEKLRDMVGSDENCSQLEIMQVRDNFLNYSKKIDI